MMNQERNTINCHLNKIPFKTSLSFEYLIEEIKQISNKKSHPMKSMAKEVLLKVDKTPIFKSVIENLSDLEPHNDLLEQMISFMINPMASDMEYAAVHMPFRFEPIYSTPLYQEVFMGDNKTLDISKDIKKDKMLISMLYQSFLIIMQKEYGMDLPQQMPFTFKVTNQDNQSVKFFNVKIDTRFLRVKRLGDVPDFSSEDIKDLLDKENDLDYWNSKIPLSKYEFTGLLKFNQFDVTRSYVISELKSDLLEKETFLTKNGFNKILERVRALMEKPNVEFGFAANQDFESTLNQNYIWNTIIPQSELSCSEYEGSVYERAYREKQIILTGDLESIERNSVVDAFLKKGIRSHAVVPLLLDDEVVGMLEFACYKANELNTLQIKLLYELFPIFALALKRSRDDWSDKVRAVIQKEYTAIHPTVEWRFREIAAQQLNQPHGDAVSNEPILFKDVVPLYGASDIRASSVIRNEAIQADLSEQLELALIIVKNEVKETGIPLLNNLSYKIKQHLDTVKAGLKAGDEVSIIDFLTKEINPILILLKDTYKGANEPVKQYFNSLDTELNVLYKRRKQFEESLTLINDKVSEIIDDEQKKAQKVFPHYFEKYRTDGIEYNAYIGQSMVRGLKYSELYLNNMRLWQLLLKVKVARAVHNLQASLTTKLDITQLILVHTKPLSIAFRLDEKKFDVAGAYNIRYEITKKRIDKALIKGSNERLTQVGKIAIIYSHSNEITEYSRYIDYLISKNYLHETVEDLELEDLKGASGLRALRVEINFNNTDALEDII
ncbi:GAF domain-containing protein [Carboxylicivirga sp. M1479]|uniref:GAF domain-containing protein n=1 Tax=Carboxylicivirga sp. M1479 TaxID=2594476 RepID=UPI001178A89A|nr:GAF domain-containing protein [Carboxylicivirga sp. M1479]TRX70208.1 GAF domain-containing protein [Carboxylicivirga sp. M1479]